jgi:hypothetical protein
MKDNIIAGLRKEIYGIYAGQRMNTEEQIYLTTDRYFEKYVLATDQGIYEIWPGGCRKKESLSLENFSLCPDFALLERARIVTVKCNETTLALELSSGACFVIGLCKDPNAYGHPERYIQLVKQVFGADGDAETAQWFEQELKETEDFTA